MWATVDTGPIFQWFIRIELIDDIANSVGNPLPLDMCLLRTRRYLRSPTWAVEACWLCAVVVVLSRILKDLLYYAVFGRTRAALLRCCEE